MELESIIKDKLHSLQKPIVDSGFPFILTTCLNPEHIDKHPSYSVNLETGNGKCFSCGFHVGSEYWVDGTLDEEEVEELLRRTKYNSLRMSLNKTEETENYTPFLPPFGRTIEDNWRGIPKNWLEKLGMYICEIGHYQNRVIFPMYNPDGNLVAFNSRALGDETPKYKYSKHIPVQTLVYPPIDYILGDKNYVVVVEGIMDAISFSTLGIPTIMNFGVNNTFGTDKIAQLLKAGVETIYIALDEDEKGRLGTVQYLDSNLKDYFEVKYGKLCPMLKPFYASGCKDGNEFLQTVKGLIKKEEEEVFTEELDMDDMGY